MMALKMTEVFSQLNCTTVASTNKFIHDQPYALSKIALVQNKIQEEVNPGLTKKILFQQNSSFLAQHV
jgi:hypothetical protein